MPAARPADPFAGLETRSPEETGAVARSLAGILDRGDVVLLVGELGAGKTTFTKALAAALGVGEPVTSPTFTIMRQYDAVLPVSHAAVLLLHLDAYRLDGPADVEDLGLFELLDGGAIAVIEWGDVVAPLFADALTITIDWVDEEVRALSFSATETSGWPERLSVMAQMPNGAGPC